jgi:peptidoglycan/LPS O-acetylase OafA/YrhL
MGLFRDMNPTLRGFLIIAAIAGVVVALQLGTTLAVVGGLVRIAFFIAIAFFLFMLWRERRSEIEAWSDRSRRAFYAAAILIVVNLSLYFSPSGFNLSGIPGVCWILVFALCIYSMVRIWRDEHTY